MKNSKNQLKSYIKEALLSEAPTYDDLEIPSTPYEEAMKGFYDWIGSLGELHSETTYVKSNLNSVYEKLENQNEEAHKEGHFLGTNNESNPDLVRKLNELEKVIIKLQKIEDVLSQILKSLREYH